jgi:hypothetical protein
MPVLAPHFAGIIYDRTSREVRYYVLEQAPTGGGTALRCITPEGMNCNLGPGPEPGLEAFVREIKDDDRSAIAGTQMW